MLYDVRRTEYGEQLNFHIYRKIYFSKHGYASRENLAGPDGPPLVVTFQRILKLVSFLNAKRPEGFRGDRSKLLWRTREDATVHMKPLHVANNHNSNSWNTFCRLVTRWIHKITPKGFKKCPICCARPGVYENSGVKTYLSQWGVICILYWPVTHWQLFYRFLFHRTRTRTIRQVAGRSPPWSQSQTHFTTALEPSLSHLG